MALIGQEMSADPWIDIPGEVLDILRLWRPTPLVRATRLEAALDTPARIYFKDESVSPAGSHKPNTAVAQTYYNKAEGIGRIATETGAGQWGSALAFACNQFGLECFVYMVAASYHQKPYRRVMMETWGGQVVPSPSDRTLPGGRSDPASGGEAGTPPKPLKPPPAPGFTPPPIHAGGLRYHGDAPIICNLVKNGWMEAVAYPQGKVFEAAMQFARSQGTIPAPETAHAIRGAIDEALAAKEAGEERVILFNYSGHGLLDLAAYDAFLHGQLVDV